MIKLEMSRDIGFLESLVADINSWPGFCDLGVDRVLERLRGAGIEGFNQFKITGGKDKPNLYVSHFQAGRSLAEVHYVALEGKGGITIDVFQSPRCRVFPTLENYFAKSGIEYTDDVGID